MSVYGSVPFSCNFFEASHWPSGHMIRSRPSRWHQYSENENIHQEMYIITTGNLPPPLSCPSLWHKYSENENMHQEMQIITTGNLPPPWFFSFSFAVVLVCISLIHWWRVKGTLSIEIQVLCPPEFDFCGFRKTKKILKPNILYDQQVFWSNSLDLYSNECVCLF